MNLDKMALAITTEAIERCMALHDEQYPVGTQLVTDAQRELAAIKALIKRATETCNNCGFNADRDNGPCRSCSQSHTDMWTRKREVTA